MTALLILGIALLAAVGIALVAFIVFDRWLHKRNGWDK